MRRKGWRRGRGPGKATETTTGCRKTHLGTWVTFCGRFVNAGA